jgi:hypothetical protein
MSPTTTGREPPDELDAEYRRLAAHDTSAPSESVRQAVHAYAARLARERRAEQRESAGRTRGRGRRLAWHGALFGTLAAAAIAAIMVAPRFLSLRAPPAAAVAGNVSVPSAVPAAGKPAALPAGETRRSFVVSAETAPPARPAAPTPQLAKAAPSNVRPATPPAREPTERANYSVAGRMVADAAAKAEQRQPQSAQEVVVTGARAPAPAAGSAADSTAAVAAPAAQGANRARAPSDAGARAPPEETDSPSNLGSGLIDAARQGNLVSARGFLDDGAEVNSRDGAGRTALLVATLGGHADMVELLLKSGADPNLADARGVTPLHAAEAAGATLIAAALRAHGAR